MPRKSINDWQIENIVEMAAKGIPQKTISEKTGVSKSMVSQIAIDNGIRRYQTQRGYNEKIFNSDPCLSIHLVDSSLQ